jgi:hypothetical protein
MRRLKQLDARTAAEVSLEKLAKAHAQESGEPFDGRHAAVLYGRPPVLNMALSPP